MADIRLSKVPSGTHQTVDCAPDSRFVFDFPAAEATITRSGDNLVFTFDDGGALELTGFYATYNSEKMPDFEIDGATVSGADFFTAMNEPDLMPAAGPATATVANGARYHEYADSSLAGGIDRLGGLDLGFEDGVEYEEERYDSGGRRSGEGQPDEYGVPVTPGTPENPDNPGTPENPGNPGNPENPDNNVPTIDHNPTDPDPIDQTNPDSPKPDQIAPDGGNGMIIVDEAALGNGTAGKGDIDHGASGTGGFNVNLHGEGGVITIGGENGYTITVDADGNVIAFKDATSGNGLTTANGVNVTIAHDALVYKDGVWTVKYDYKLTGSQTHGEAGKVEGDTLSDTISITVEDSTGDLAGGSINVEVHDDGPKIEVTDNYKATVNFGADDGTGDAGTGALTVKVFAQGGNDAFTWKTTTGEDTDLNHMNVGESWTSGDVTVTRTDAGYEFKSSQSGSTTLTVKATDADGDTDQKDVTMTAPVVTPDPNNPDNPTPPVDPDHTHPQAPVSSILVDEGRNPEHDGDGHPGAGKGSFRVDLNGEDGTILVGDETNGYTITVKDGQASVTPHGVLAAQGVTVSIGEVTQNPDNSWTIKYDYKLDGNQKHVDANGKPVDTLHSDITITVTDTSGNDTASGLLHVEVHDDAPVLKVTNFGQNFGSTTSSQLKFYNDTSEEGNGFVDAANVGNWTEFNDGKLGNYNGQSFNTPVTYKGVMDGTKIIATTVRYENGDVTTIKDMAPADPNPSSPDKHLYNSSLTGKNNGLTIGDDGSNWQGDKDVNADKVWNAHEIGLKPGDNNLSEAVVLEVPKDTVSYGLNLELGSLTNSDRVLVTFMSTPQNNNDDIIVKQEYVDVSKLAGDPTNLKVHFDVPQGFTKVFISAVANEGEGVPESGFTVREVELLTNSAVSTGRVDVNYGADGPGELTWDLSGNDWQNVEIINARGHGAYKVTLETSKDGLTFTGKLAAAGALLDGRTLFIATLDPKSGEWTFTQFYEFKFADGTDTATLKFGATDKDGSTATVTGSVSTTAPGRLDRFDDVDTGYYDKNWGSDASKDNAVDVMAGKNGNDLMYGKGGDDILSGDGGVDAIAAIGHALTKWEFTTDNLKYFAENDGYKEGNDNPLERDGQLTIEGVQERIEQAIKGEAASGWGTGITLAQFTDTLAELETEHKDWDGDDALFGGKGNDILFGWGGDDYLHGGDGSDMIFAGGGDDLIVYDSSDYLVHGGSGIDFLLSGKDENLHLDALLNNTNPKDGPMVSEVEVLLKGDAVTTLTSLKELEDYGIKVEDDTLTLGEGWTLNENGHYTYKDSSIILETTLEGTPQENGTIVFSKDGDLPQSEALFSGQSGSMDSLLGVSETSDTMPQEPDERSLDLTNMDTRAYSGLGKEREEKAAGADSGKPDLERAESGGIPGCELTEASGNEEELAVAINAIRAETGGC